MGPEPRTPMLTAAVRLMVELAIAHRPGTLALVLHTMPAQVMMRLRRGRGLPHGVQLGLGTEPLPGVASQAIETNEISMTLPRPVGITLRPRPMDMVLLRLVLPPRRLRDGLKAPQPPVVPSALQLPARCPSVVATTLPHLHLMRQLRPWVSPPHLVRVTVMMMAALVMMRVRPVLEGLWVFLFVILSFLEGGLKPFHP